MATAAASAPARVQSKPALRPEGQKTTALVVSSTPAKLETRSVENISSKVTPEQISKMRKESNVECVKATLYGATLAASYVFMLVSAFKVGVLIGTFVANLLMTTALASAIPFIAMPLGAAAGLILGVAALKLVFEPLFNKLENHWTRSENLQNRANQLSRLRTIRA